MSREAIDSSAPCPDPGDAAAAEPQFAPLPPGDTLIECAAVTRAIEDEISWLAEPDTIGSLSTDSPRPPLYSLLALIDTFDGAMRIRKARPGELGSEHLLVIEGKHGWKGLPKDSTDAVISPAVAHELLHFDDAGVLHVTDRGRELIVTKGDER